MALIKCPECEGQVSDKAYACPHCGYPIKDMIKKHATLMTEYKPEYMVVREMRKHVSWYTTGLHNCAALRDEVNHTETLQELFSLLDKRMIDK